jgi:hypothetical protein
MEKSPTARGPPSPIARRLNRSKSVFSLAQDFFKMRINATPEESIPSTLDNYAKPRSWNIFGSLRGTWNGTNLSSSSQKTERRSTSQYMSPLDTRKYPTE